MSRKLVRKEMQALQFSLFIFLLSHGETLICKRKSFCTYTFLFLLIIYFCFIYLPSQISKLQKQRKETTLMLFIYFFFLFYQSVTA